MMLKAQGQSVHVSDLSVTSTAAELNILDGVTSTGESVLVPQFNIVLRLKGGYTR